jgi:poly(3-hydroxybutyrate) depolymerase
MCEAAVGDEHSFLVGGEKRCFSLWVPPNAASPAPVALMHHGLDADAGQLCNNHFIAQAQEHGIALLCTQALSGSWRFGRLPWAAEGSRESSSALGNACDDSDSADLAYMRQVYAYLHTRPTVLDPHRVFHIGYSQGALFAACERGGAQTPLELAGVDLAPILHVPPYDRRRLLL